MTSYHTTADAALALGVSVRRVQALARRRGLGEKRGRDWLFRPADLAALAVKGKSGRPRKVQPDNHDNHLGTKGQDDV